MTTPSDSPAKLPEDVEHAITVVENVSFQYGTGETYMERSTARAALVQKIIEYGDRRAEEALEKFRRVQRL